MAWTPFGLNTLKQIISGQGVTPVQNLVGGFTHPGSPVSTVPITGPNAPLDYSNSVRPPATNVLGTSNIDLSNFSFGTNPALNLQSPALTWDQVEATDPYAQKGGGQTDGGQTDGGQTINTSGVNNAFLDAIRQAQGFREGGMRTFNDIINSVGRFRQRSGELRDTADQQITNTFSDILANNARMGREAMTNSVRRGRAMGLGDSSKFRNQNQIQGRLNQTQGNAVAQRGENRLENTNMYNSRMDQAQGTEDQANTYRQGIEGTYSNLVGNANTNYQNAIATLQQLVGNMGNLRGLDSSGLTAMSPNTNFTNTLNSVVGSAGGNQTAGMEASNLAAPLTYEELDRLARRRMLPQGLKM